ncbi:DUF1109 family protein [bacterium]|nr:DUF1109 family protein [bacterium]
MSLEQKNLFDFIAADVDAGRKIQKLRWGVATAALLIPAVSVVGQGFNPNLTWAGSWTPWVMLLSFASAAAFFARTLGRAANVFGLSAFSGAVLALAMVLPQFGAGFAPMVDQAGYWLHTLRCFGFGLMMGGITSCVLIFSVYRWGPVPDSGTRLVMSQVAGLSGVVGLFFYCPNSDLVHLFTGHGLQTAFVFVGAYLLSEILFSQIIRKQLGKAARQFDSLRKFDKE